MQMVVVTVVPTGSHRVSAYAMWSEGGILPSFVLQGETLCLSGDSASLGILSGIYNVRNETNTVCISI